MTQTSGDRAKILLQAAYDLLKKCDDEPWEVLDVMEQEVFYDGTSFDGTCLMIDIAAHLNIEEVK